MPVTVSYGNTAPAPFVIDQTTVPAGTVGVAYDSGALTTSGGTGNVVMVHTSGDFPMDDVGFHPYNNKLQGTPV